MKQFFFLMLLIISVTDIFSQTKVACIGNSITYGATLKDPSTESYPSRLQEMLGADYEVRNFGESGSTLLFKGHSPYIKRKGFHDALQFKADIAVIHLGINDTDPRDWPKYGDDFVKDYLSLLDSLRQDNPGIRIIIARMSPIFEGHLRFNSGTKQWHAKIQKQIELVSRVSGVELIDFYQPFLMHPEMFNDVLHPNTDGASVMAEVVFREITGDFGGLRMPVLFSDNMVFQRDMPITISGVANAEEKVTISFFDKRASVIASKNGKWNVTFPAIHEPKTNLRLTVSTKNRKLSYSNICIGEVWLCSGQSNMLFKQGETLDGPFPSDNNLRFFNMKPINTDNRSWTEGEIDSINNHIPFSYSSWEECTSSTSSQFSAIACYFGKILRDSLDVPVGLILNAVGGAPQESWIDRQTLENDYQELLIDWIHNDFTQGWCRERALQNMKNSRGGYIHHPYEPGMLFEGGIRPLGKFAVKGVIWYQGESNEHCCETFENLFRLFVKSWRGWWNRNDLPIYYAQLSSLNRPQWPWVRDMQRRMLDSLDYVGMAVTSDIGNEYDVHPKQKKPVGERLARWALYYQYGKTNITVSGPLARSAEFRNGKAVVSFDYSNGLKTSDGKPLRTFEVAKYDGLFYPANAIIEDDKVVLTSSQVDTINLVRYGWTPYTDANLVNSDELPASTFKITINE